jgi:hypothetical protein
LHYMSFSFLPHRILEQFPHLIPGIEKVICIQRTTGREGISGLLMEKIRDEYEIHSLIVDYVGSFIDNVSRSGLHYQWYSREEIPFTIINKQKVQLSIFNELKNSVLVLHFLVSDADVNVTYVVYFNENLSNFLLEKVSEPLSTQHKPMVGFLVFHAIKTLSEVFRLQELTAIDLKHRIEEVVKERDNLREREDQIAALAKNHFLTMAQHYLDKICRNSKQHALFTDSAKEKILTFKGEIFLLEPILLDAFNFARTLSPSSGDAVIRLSDYHIHFPDLTSPELPKPIVSGLTERFQKTHILLDRLENASSSLKEKRGQLTSTNVGREFPTPISAPAITDALKKHKKRILELFGRYPDKWMIIRTEFRPVLNLINSVNQDEALSA